jgi:creatinine amidohydrolase
MAEKFWTYAMEEMSYPDVKEILKTTDVVLIPIGSQEKHGPHIPLACDSIASIETTKRAAYKAEVPYTPLIPVGYSPHHMGEVNQGVGSLTFTGETLRRIVYEIGKSLVFHGFNKLIFVSQHASNTKVVDEALRRLRYESGAFVAWYMTPTERRTQVIAHLLEEKVGWHSGEMETSQCLAYNEKACHMDRAHNRKAHAPAWLGPEFAKKDGVPTVVFQGTENIFILLATRSSPVLKRAKRFLKQPRTTSVISSLKSENSLSISRPGNTISAHIKLKVQERINERYRQAGHNRDKLSIL